MEEGDRREGGASNLKKVGFRACLNKGVCQPVNKYMCETHIETFTLIINKEDAQRGHACMCTRPNNLLPCFLFNY